MTENDLKRDILIAVNRLAPPTFANDISVPIESVIDSVLPILLSYTNALVAAAGSECAKHIPHIYYDEQGAYLGCECGWKTYSRITWAEHLSTVTPESAAKELECIKAEARTSMFDEFWDYIAAHYAVPAGKYTPAELIQKLASIIQIEARLEGAEEAESLIECTCNKKTLPEDLCYVHSYIKKQRDAREAAKEK